MKEGPWTFRSRIRTRLSDGLATYDFFYSRGMVFLLHPCEYEHPATPGLGPVQARVANPPWYSFSLYEELSKKNDLMNKIDGLRTQIRDKVMLLNES